MTTANIGQNDIPQDSNCITTMFAFANLMHAHAFGLEITNFKHDNKNLLESFKDK
jgi:hypothetical protein